MNSLLPQVVAKACAERGVRFLHVSTDCVFSGRTGCYIEADLPDPPDLYGRSKLLGEVGAPGLTVRTSIIGWQLSGETGLLEWFAAHHREPLQGYAEAFLSGLSTSALARLLWHAGVQEPRLEGVWHVSAERIDKYPLLSLAAAALGWDVDLTPVNEPRIDRSLDSSAFRSAMGWEPPSWKAMLDELASLRSWYLEVRAR